VKDVGRYLFFDKVKSLGIGSCLYEIPKNDLVDDMKLWPPVTYPEVYCYLIETPGDFIGEKLKGYNFVISRFPMCTVNSSKRRETSLGKTENIQLCDFSGGSSHYRCWSAILVTIAMTQPPPIISPIFPPTSVRPLFIEGLGISP